MLAHVEDLERIVLEAQVDGLALRPGHPPRSDAVEPRGHVDAARA